MKIRIGEREYPVVDHRGAKLLHLVELREHTRRLLEEPLGMARLDEMSRASRALARDLAAAERDHAAARDDGAGPEQLEELAQRVRRLKGEQADDGLLGMAIIVFLSRRAAGERVTFAQATDVDVESLQWVEEPGDVAVVPPAGDDPDADPFGPDPTAPGTAAADASRAILDDVPPVAADAPTAKVRPRRAGRSTTSRSR